MYALVDRIVRMLKKIVPETVVRPLRPIYHRLLAYLMAFSYDFPARKLTVIGVTGTKGKSTVAEMVFAILRRAGYKTALISTIRLAIEDDSKPNLSKMTLQGRGFAQSFMSKALSAGCTHLVIEITSESVLQYRHWFLELDGLIVTNIQREHIERHGSFGNYVAAKRAIVGTLEKSSKRFRTLVVNGDLPETASFLSARVTNSVGFYAHELHDISGDERQISFKYNGVNFSLPIPGVFNAMNALSAVKLAEAFNISTQTSSAALAELPQVHGRVEHIDAGQDFLVVVDYAHTPDSLSALYGTFPNHHKICVLGNTGGGRDTWKRPEMGRIADEACEKVILTNEDPYDENPRTILEEMARGMRRKPEIVMDRRAAIRSALREAQNGDVVLISGKGTDPFIMGPNGSREPWSDANVAREELVRLLSEV